MRIVVMSDSHGNTGVLRKILLAQASAEVFLHLGDGERDFRSLVLEHPDKMMCSVRGNSDWGSDSKLMDMVTVERRRVLFTHGHTLGVKQSPDLVLDEALHARAHIALYGHTHVAATDYRQGVYLMNPGSVAQPRHGKPTYGVIDITEAGIVTRLVAL